MENKSYVSTTYFHEKGDRKKEDNGESNMKLVKYILHILKHGYKHLSSQRGSPLNPPRGNFLWSFVFHFFNFF